MRQGSARHAWPRVLLAAWVLLAASFAAADVAVPPLKSRVTDLTDTLSAEQQAIIPNCRRKMSLAGVRASQKHQPAIRAFRKLDC